MTSWILIPCLKQLFTEFNTIATNRSKKSDGSVGDLSHQESISDHNPDETGNTPRKDADNINEVHAIDVDSNLRQPGLTMEMVIQFLLSECRKKGTTGTDRGRLRYIIYNKRIWEASNNWEQRTYVGASPHVEHAHFSAEYDTAFENDTRTWGIVDRFSPRIEEDLPMDQAQFNKLLKQALLDIKIPDYALRDYNGQERELTVAGFIGYADGRADVARVEKKVNDLSKRMDKLEDYLIQQTKFMQDILRRLPASSTEQSRGAVNL